MPLDPSSSHADENPLLTTVDLTCRSPGCGGIVNVQANEQDQTEACEDCGRLHDIRYDGEGLGYSLTLSEPPNWSEVEGDLRYHDRN